MLFCPEKRFCILLLLFFNLSFNECGKTKSKKQFNNLITCGQER